MGCKKLMGVGNANGVAFSPDSISGLALWLDANDSATRFQDSAGTTPSVSDSDPVGRWTDKSGAGKHVTQTTGSRRGTLKLSIVNGKPVVRFDGVDDDLSNASRLLTSVNGFAFFFVVHTVGATLTDGNRAFGYNSPAENDLALLFPDGKPALRVAGGEPAANGPSSRSGGTASFMLSVVSNGTTITMWDNQVVGTPRTQSVSGFSSSADGFGLGSLFGGSGYTQIDFAEILAWSVALSAGQRGQVETYLTSKWGAFS